MKRLLVLGAGYSAAHAAARLVDRFDWIVGTTRSVDKIAFLRKLGLRALIFDGKAGTELRAAIDAATHLLVSIAPDENGDPVLRACGDLLASAQNLEWICYLSTVGVYGDHDGAWVDEETPCRPVSRRSKQRLQAEAAWQEFAAKRGIPLAILRLSGIYGPGRNAFVNMEQGRARRLVKPGQVFNRIHRDDIASAIAAALEQRADGIFNITDNEPAPPQDVVTLAHALAGREPPPEIDFETAELSPMARSFYGENKRVSNAKSKSELGMEYAFPDYRTAFRRMWEEDGWR